MTKISIILPSYNVAKYIEECIESVINQTLKETEIICVDAGSTDGTIDILENYAKKDSRIIIVHSNKKSYGYQVNIGINKAKGKYIGIVETDDFIDKKMYEELYDYANKLDADVVKTPFIEYLNKRIYNVCYYAEKLNKIFPKKCLV
jgi:glycosyltransferase involved in cell wall biosynthesis